MNNEYEGMCYASGSGNHKEPEKVIRNPLIKGDIHNCEANDELKSSRRGHAINSCWEEENGELWVANGEYSSQVHFCPYCGYQSVLYVKPLNQK